jgi:hypothetical protein
MLDISLYSLPKFLHNYRHNKLPFFLLNPTSFYLNMVRCSGGTRSTTNNSNALQNTTPHDHFPCTTNLTVLCHVIWPFYDENSQDLPILRAASISK